MIRVFCAPMWLNRKFNILSIYDEKKIFFLTWNSDLWSNWKRIKTTLEISKLFNTRKKFTRYTLPPLKLFALNNFPYFKTYTQVCELPVYQTNLYVPIFINIYKYTDINYI